MPYNELVFLKNKLRSPFTIAFHNCREGISKQNSYIPYSAESVNCLLNSSGLKNKLYPSQGYLITLQK